jgi:hypothetical protein
VFESPIKKITLSSAKMAAEAVRQEPITLNTGFSYGYTKPLELCKKGVNCKYRICNYHHPERIVVAPTVVPALPFVGDFPAIGEKCVVRSLPVVLASALAPKKQTKKQSTTECRDFSLYGKCKFGTKCMFTHTSPLQNAFAVLDDDVKVESPRRESAVKVESSCRESAVKVAPRRECKFGANCTYGTKCLFAHTNTAASTIRKSTTMCKNGKNCRFGKACKFSHE